MNQSFYKDTVVFQNNNNLNFLEKSKIKKILSFLRLT